MTWKGPIRISPGAHSGDAAGLRLGCSIRGIQVIGGPDDGSMPALTSVEESHWLRDLGFVHPWPAAFMPLMGRPWGTEASPDGPKIGDWIKPTIPKAFATWRWLGTEALPPTFYWSVNIPDIYGEIRLYVSRGRVLHSAQYDDSCTDLSTESFEIAKALVLAMSPTNWVGTVDVAVVNDGIRLVECHEPWACGLYGINQSDSWPGLFEWMCDGWEWLVNNRANRPARTIMDPKAAAGAVECRNGGNINGRD